MSGSTLADTTAPLVPQRGFSLLELLVTLFVVVLVTSLVTLNVTSGGTDIRLEYALRNLADTAAYALDEAQFTGVDYGLVLEEVEQGREPVYRYSWRELGPEGWRAPETGKEVFDTGKLPPGIELTLELEDVAAADLSPRDAQEEMTPQVVLYASGETIHGAIDVRNRDGGELLWRLEWDLLGRINVLRRGIEEPPP